MIAHDLYEITDWYELTHRVFGNGVPATSYDNISNVQYYVVDVLGDLSSYNMRIEQT